MKVIEARAAHWLAPERQRRLIFEHYLNADAVRKFLTEDSIMPDPTPPAKPARLIPRLKTTWLDAGPGRNWQSATRSA